MNKRQAAPSFPDKEAARQVRHFLDTAFEVISESGWQRLTVAAVAKTAAERGDGRVLEPLPRSKRALTLALLEDCRVEWRGEMQKCLKKGLKGDFALIALFDGMVRLFRKPGIMRGRLLLFFELTGTRDEALRRATREAQAGIRVGLVAILNDGIRSGHFKSSNVEMLGILINGTCRGIGYQWVLDPESIDIRAALREVENILVRALGPE